MTYSLEKRTQQTTNYSSDILTNKLQHYEMWSLNYVGTPRNLSCLRLNLVLKMNP